MNSGPPVRVGLPVLRATGYTVLPISAVPMPIAHGATSYVTFRVQIPCPAAAADSRAMAVVTVPMTPASGRVRQVPIRERALGLADLGRMACGFVPPDQAAQPEVTEAQQAGPVGVSFRLTVHNTSGLPFRLAGLDAEGLELMSAELPAEVPARGVLSVPVQARIASCSHLPTALDLQRLDSLPFAAFELELRDGVGRAYSRPYLTSGDARLYDEVRTLARRQCPRAFFSPS
jgi:hypothetical protein